MRDLVEHLSTGPTLDLPGADNGGPRTAVVEDGRAGLVLSEAANDRVPSGTTGSVGA
jgi:hypothetical protein